MGRTTFTRQELERRLESAFVGFSVANAVGATLTLLGSTGSGPDEKFLTLAGGATVCIATIFTFWTSSKLSRLMKLDMLKNERQIALANRDVAEAQRLTAEAVRNTAEAHERIAAMQRPRRLTGTQRSEIASFIKRMVDDESEITWYQWYSVVDAEALDFARELRSVFMDGGMVMQQAGHARAPVEAPAKVGTLDFVAGIHPSSNRASVDRLVAFLRTQGLQGEVVLDRERSENSVGLCVLKKPNA